MKEIQAHDFHGISRSAARRIMKHLVDGTVPGEGLEILTAGREPWLESFGEDLELVKDGDCRVRIFNGRYGDGKTHLMKVLRLLALRQGLTVSYVPITKDIPLNRWDYLYREIVRGLHTLRRPERHGLTAILDPQDPDPDIKEVFVERAERIRNIPSVHPDFATAIYRFTTRQGTTIDVDQDMLTLRNWLEGQPVETRILRELAISSRIDRHAGPTMLKSLVACLNFFGIPAVLFLFDEVECTLVQSKPVRNQAYENLRLFIDRDNMPRRSLVVISSTPEMFTDIERGFGSYPALWRRIGDVGTSKHVNYRATLVDLSKTPLKNSDLFEIGKRIRQVHAIARQWNAEARVSDDYLKQAADLAASGRLSIVFSPTGIFVKLIAEELEVAEQNTSYVPSIEHIPQRIQQVDDGLQKTRAPGPWERQ